MNSWLVWLTFNAHPTIRADLPDPKYLAIAPYDVIRPYGTDLVTSYTLEKKSLFVFCFESGIFDSFIFFQTEGEVVNLHPGSQKYLFIVRFN